MTLPGFMKLLIFKQQPNNISQLVLSIQERARTPCLRGLGLAADSGGNSDADIRTVDDLPNMWRSHSSERATFLLIIQQSFIRNQLRVGSRSFPPRCSMTAKHFFIVQRTEACGRGLRCFRGRCKQHSFSSLGGIVQILTFCIFDFMHSIINLSK